MLPVEDTESLARLFHANSPPRLHPTPADEPPYEFHYKQVAPLAESVRLPALARPPVLALLQQRRHSCRAFAPRELPLDDLSALLMATYAMLEPLPPVEPRTFLPRSVPSAGGLYPLELYALVQRVPGLPDGLYHYDVRAHGLEPMRQGPMFDDISSLLLGQYFVDDANVVLVFTAVFERTLTKYGSRGYRYILFEAGHAAQNACLVAVERGLATLCMGGFSDARLNGFLDLDGIAEAALYCVAVGHPLGQADGVVAGPAAGAG